MNTNRRNFLKAGILASGTVGLNLNAEETNTVNDPFCSLPKKTDKVFDFSKEPKRIRKSFYDLTDEEVKNLCRAIGAMRNNVPLNNAANWQNYALLHAFHCTDAGIETSQVHWSWYFLPWHRGYIYFMERIAANCLKQYYPDVDGSNFAYPYWDWSNQREMPNTKERIASNISSPLFGYDLSKSDMTEADGLGFDNLALFDGYRKPTPSDPKMSIETEVGEDNKLHIAETEFYMSAEYINAVLQTPFEMFGGKRKTDRATGQGLIEQNPHNNGHDWVGERYGSNRDMGTLRYAALDPIFYMHHGNIDRIWSLYKNKMPSVYGPWGDQEYTYVDIDGSPITVSVKDIVTKLSPQIEYQRPSNERIEINSNSENKMPEMVSIPVYKVLNHGGLSIKIDDDKKLTKLINDPSIISMISIETGPISYVDKFRINIFNDRKYIGRISMLDGRSADDPKDLTISHGFTTTVGISPKSLKNTMSTVLDGYPKNLTLSLHKVKDKNFSVLIKEIKFIIIK